MKSQAAESMFCSFDQFSAIVATCQRSKVGKVFPDALYVHVWALQALDFLLQDYESEARQIAPDVEGATLVKFSIGKPVFLACSIQSLIPIPIRLYKPVLDLFRNKKNGQAELPNP